MLSTRLLRQPACQLVARSAVTSQASICRPSIRSFHASAARQDPLLDALLFLPHEMMSFIHSTVPWYAAIPLTAFMTRAILVTTAGSWSRALTARYIGLHPLRQALAFQKRDEVMRRGDFSHPKEAVRAVSQEIKQMTNQLDKRWNVSLRGQIGWTFAQIPIFFAMAETIRQKCGARDGLLGLGFSAFRSEDAAAGAGEAVVTSSRWFEPSLANEGMLWFQDLLLPDPIGALPFLVSGLMFTNIYMTKNTVNSDGRWPTYVRRSLLLVSLLIGPMCQQLPAALLLYWAGSTSSVMLWNAWLDWKYPAPRGFMACKRPLQMPPVPATKGRRV
ncbi:hypothetical protein N0V83_008858 [Neocucurbitaria cava]|uniref:Membrane insertase YidC/Oxa/ALB C-terminal domain-containing protein n=1 Tax=Neocucurbitaria cava TaxID=798079 RepID=A0A9W8Y179_9PLEO|nr:hypothetical protein N0V83_008858 [Neocucurbitaria cava]